MQTTESRGSLSEYLTACRTLPERDRRNARVANFLLALWAITMLGALYSLSRDLIPSGPLTVLAVVVPTILAVLGVLAFIRFLRHADELHRIIQFEAMALGFAAGFVASFALELAEQAGWGTFDAGDTFAAMILFYLVGFFFATRRYA